MPQEWDAETVISLIDRRKLAPFYRALQDELEDNRDPAVTSRQLEIALEGAGATQDSEVTGHHGRAGMRSKEPSAHRKAEVNAYLSGTSECPICMMYAPPSDFAFMSELCLRDVRCSLPGTFQVI